MVRVSAVAREGLRFAATPDVMDVAEAEALARALARWAPTDEAERLLNQRAAEARAGQDFLDALGIFDARTWDPRLAWSQVTPAERLRVPMGKSPGGQVTYLDIKEGAENGVGPHGSMTGQTGSGKSEHLRTLVLAWAARFPPETVQMLLGDFKGESAFAGLENLPHVQGIVSNLEKSAHKLDRFELVLRGELNRRQEMLNRTGFTGVREYEAARAAGRDDLEPLGALILVLDEFSQLLELRPGMAKVMDEVARLGRSLWIHILNASQRQDVGKMSGMIAQQTYAIGLKVKNAGESRAAIGSARAWEEFKNAPQGSAFLVVDGDHDRYRSFYVSGPYTPPKMNASQRDRAEGQYLPAARFTVGVVPLPDSIEEEGAEDDGFQDSVPADAPSLLTIMVDRCRAAGASRPRHKLWLPALDETLALPVDEVVEEFWGRPWDALGPDAGLVVPYGREDDPLHHSQDVIATRLVDAHLGVGGAPQAGKSTAVRTVLMAMAMGHSPARVQFYGIDCGGGKLQSLAALPHCSGIAGHGDEERIRRIVSEVERILRFRKRNWATWGENGIDLIKFRALKFGPTPAPVPDDGHGDVFLVVDNIRVIQNEMMDLHDRINQLAEGALNFGIHLIVANDQWITVRAEAKLGSKIELRMADSSDSKMGNREAAKQIPEEQKGRGLVRGGNHMLVAVPYLARFAGAANEVAATEATAHAVAARWAESGFGPAPKLQQLPAEIGYRDLPPAPRGQLKIGIGEREMTSVGLDLRAAPHTMCVGTRGSGRTTFLRTVCAAIMENYAPFRDAEPGDTRPVAQVVLFDSPGGDGALIDAVEARYRGVYATTVKDVSEASQGLAQLVEQRRPPSDLPPEQLRGWKPPPRPTWFIVVDDLNLLAQSGGLAPNAMIALTGAIEAPRNLDLHVIAGTIGDNWYSKGKGNKVIQAMELGGVNAVILDGNKSEVIIDNIRPAARIPGRAELYNRRAGGQMVQIALPPGWIPPVEEDR